MEGQNTTSRLMPCDIKGFEKIRSGGYVYLDKTEFVYKLTHSGMSYVYLSRPKRFGKSLLLDTLDCYYSGRRSLFEGLWIDHKVPEAEWPKLPVIRLDMSEADGGLEECRQHLSNTMSHYEEVYGLSSDPAATLGQRFSFIIKAAAAKGKVVVLVDEYDAPLVAEYVRQKSGETNQLAEITTLYRSIFGKLKALEGNLHFVMLTGCTRFNNMSIFSVLNNLYNISVESEWATLCGFTKGEIEATYGPELDIIAAKRGECREATLAMLCKQYDGYLFSYMPAVERVYNPFSLVRALKQMTSPQDDAQLPGTYWTGTSGGYALQKWATELEKMITKLPNCFIHYDDLTDGDITSPNPLLLMYQAGYLTIDHREGENIYLRIPNGEISRSIFKQLLPALLNSETMAFERAMSEFRAGLRSGDVERGLWGVRRLMSKAEWGSKAYKGAAPEERATLLFTYLCYSAPFRVACEPKQAYGTPDRVVEAGDYIYVMEFKRPSEGGINKAWRQMRERRYVEAYVGEANDWGAPKTVVALVLVVREDGKALIDWQAKSYAIQGGQLLVGKVRKSAPRWKQLEGDLGDKE